MILMAMSSIIDFVNWAHTCMDSACYPFGDVANLPYEIAWKASQLILGFIAWIINLIFNGNPVSTWLVSDEVLTVISFILLAVIIFAVGFIINLTMIWEERKILGRVMDRRATRIGPLGYFQCVGDGLKTFMKENIAPKAVDKKVYWWSLILVIGTSVLLACMVPLSERWFIADYKVGLFILFGIFALAPFLILCSGWSQNNKYSLIGGMRAAELMISYEVPMLIILATTCLLAGSFGINDIVRFQDEHLWFIVPEILGFFVFFIAAIAESERVPFDLSEAEAELVEGWQTEYAGMKWGLIMLADYFRGYVACAFIVLLFLGGWAFPWLGVNSPIPEIIFILKVCLVFAFFVLARGAMPRVRTDQIINLGWKVLMPLAVVNLAIVIAVKLAGWM